MREVTTISFFSYQTLKGKVWAFGMMQFAHKYLKQVDGLKFYKLLGTGKGKGFNPWPDYSTYALLQVWDTEESAKAFFLGSQLLMKYDLRSHERWTLYLKSIKANGTWSGANPFNTSETLSDGIPYLAVITRATIRKNKLRTFWRYVPTSEKPLMSNEGLIFTKGIGEVPFLQMATFSLWKDKHSLDRFAYGSREHAKAIKLTKEVDWYSEELFSRFQPYRSVGTWNGENPLPDLTFK